MPGKLQLKKLQKIKPEKPGGEGDWRILVFHNKVYLIPLKFL